MALRSLSSLLEGVDACVWRADALAQAASGTGPALASGHAALDAQLPGGGWPVGALIEVLQQHSGLHEWRLLLPALCALPKVRTREQRVVLVGPPYVPFGPGVSAQGLDASALLWVQAESAAERLWAAEQALRCAGVAALLVWLPQVRADHLRRLHLAAQEHARLLFVMRGASAQNESSPAVLRLLVGSPSVLDVASDPAYPCPNDTACALQVHILKRRGPPLAHRLDLPARHAALAVLLAVHRPLGASIRMAPFASPGSGLVQEAGWGFAAGCDTPRGQTTTWAI